MGAPWALMGTTECIGLNAYDHKFLIWTKTINEELTQTGDFKEHQKENN